MQIVCVCTVRKQLERVPSRRGLNVDARLQQFLTNEEGKTKKQKAPNVAR